jgi:hypothetical protein
MSIPVIPGGYRTARSIAGVFLIGCSINEKKAIERGIAYFV